MRVRLARLFWTGAAALLGAAALVAVAAVLRGDFTETDGKILGILATALLAGGVALAGLALVERREGGRLARIVEHARDAGAEVEIGAEPFERRRRVPGDEHGVRAGRRPPGGGREVVAGARQRLGVEGWVELLDVEAVLVGEPRERAARRGGDLRADPVAGEAGDDVRLPGRHRFRGVGVAFMAVLLSLGTSPGRTSSGVSVGVCAVVGA